MRLDELISVKKYKDRSVWDVLKDFEKAGGELLGNGKHAMVIGHPTWNYVFKTFPKDDDYLRFIRFVKRNPRPAFPTVLGGPWKIVPFYRRPVSEPYLYVVKLEKLEPITDPTINENIVRWVHEGWQALDNSASDEAEEGVEAYRQAKAEYDSAKDRTARYKAQDRMLNLSQWRSLARMQEIWEQYPSLKELCAAYAMLMRSGIRGSEDLHAGNFMQRKDGTLVMIDPLWNAPSVYAEYDAVRKAELDHEPIEDDEYNTIQGGKLRPKKRPKTVWTPPDDEDMPF